ncbi:hypothetical protein CH278_23960 [Rhodococcus sp. 05-2254-5]|nr:hypothetical protein CH278_23960 [Rhodococcus sp. 05-2254-5]OZE38169.1 hypothetical protein CH256_07685 [Rhodococcus sp. 05-2254-6]OZE57029.1 hypothetical protein CH269_13700 [Rhodococcus sp. 05-2254-1]OZE72346.1 hypothetical protein CH305_28455 [Rhodococcus sp. 15-649-2-2]
MAACSLLEIQIGMIGWAAKNGKPWTENWMDVAKSSGAAVELCKSQLRSMDTSLADDVRALLAEAQPVFHERNNFAHAVFTLDPTRPGDEQWVLKSARVAEFKPLTAKEGSVLVATTNRLSKRAKALSARASGP